MHISTHLHAGVDFNTSVFDLSFGKSEELIRMLFSTNNDSRAELTEGFLCYLEVIGDQLHPRDVGRIDFFNQLVLVRILDNDGKDVCPVSVKTYVALSIFTCVSIYLLRSGDKLVNFEAITCLVTCWKLSLKFLQLLLLQQ